MKTADVRMDWNRNFDMFWILYRTKHYPIFFGLLMFVLSMLRPSEEKEEIRQKKLEELDLDNLSDEEKQIAHEYLRQRHMEDRRKYWAEKIKKKTE
jgi:hypothetical protein